MLALNQEVNRLRFILSGGGTGGHIYPAVTIARALEAKLAQMNESCEVLFVGTEHGLETEIIPKEGYDLRTINVRGLERRLSLRNVKTLLEAGGSVFQSMKIIRQFAADAVIGTGGYVCGPVLLAAALLKKPTLIQEQNVVAGITNKILAHFVDRVAVGYAEAAPAFSRSTQVVVTGNPIRPDVLGAKRQTAYEKLGLAPDKRTILVSGGSRGARSINQAMIDVHQALKQDAHTQILHVTGAGEYNNIVGILKEKGIEQEKNGNLKIVPYLYDMPQALACADLAIFRAGAIGLAELTAKGIPAILIPYPYAAENHQEYNARILERNGAAVVIRDRELTGKKLLTALKNLLDQPSSLASMASASRKLGRPEAAQDIAAEILNLAGKGPMMGTPAGKRA